ncbi:MAG: multicomponent Na+:H+ antiporter subunit E [Candidatus Marinamargulisbacteria bacterium]|jgi:multicomponent Na+:H+ antiporter subunit E
MERRLKFLLSFMVMFLPWLVLSGNFDAFHLTVGVLCSAFVAFWSGDLLFQDGSATVGSRLGVLFRLAKYFVWLFYEIVIANMDVFYVACHPKALDLINPQMRTFKTKLKGDLAKFCLANSITLTPGTVTVRLDKDEFLVHALTDKVADGLPGDMEARVAHVFGEKI